MDYEKIPGWFDFREVYERMVQDAPPTGAVFIEVGAWYGKSTVCMAELIKNSCKDISFTTIDNWAGITGTEDFNNEVFQAFCKNIHPWEEYVTAAVCDSVVAAACIPDKSCDFVFIDGAHDYLSVLADINAWLPKIKLGGYIGGHDHTAKHIGVVRAVQERLGVPEVIGSSWLWHNK